MNPLLLVDSYKIHHSTYELTDQVSDKEEQKGELKTVFKDSMLIRETTLEEIRNRLK